jgi:hypothetical protein
MIPHRAARRPRAAALASACVLGALASLGPGWDGAARALDQPPAVTWSAGPADAEGPDGRARVELDADPGESIAEHLYVRNLSSIDVVFDLSAQDGYLTAQGRFNMLPSDAESVDSGTWIDLPDRVTVAAESTAIVPYSIDVPADATPGDHIAGIAASVRSGGTAGSGPALSVESRVGFRVSTRVNGTIQPRLDVVSTAIGYDTAWNPFAAGSIDVEYTVANTGNVRLETTGTVSASGAGLTASATPDPAEIFPGDERTFRARVDEVWPLGFAVVTIDLRPAVSGSATGEPPADVQTSRTEVLVWTIPWSQLLLSGAIGLLLFALLLGRRRRRSEIARMLEEARREGARSAVEAAPTAPPRASRQP